MSRLIAEAKKLTNLKFVAQQPREKIPLYISASDVCLVLLRRSEVFDTVIPRNVRLTEAPSHGKPVMLHDLKSSGSAAYLELTREVLNHDY